jgi:hypothetical protein
MRYKRVEGTWYEWPCDGKDVVTCDDPNKWAAFLDGRLTELWHLDPATDTPDFDRHYTIHQWTYWLYDDKWEPCSRERYWEVIETPHLRFTVRRISTLYLVLWGAYLEGRLLYRGEPWPLADAPMFTDTPSAYGVE